MFRGMAPQRRPMGMPQPMGRPQPMGGPPIGQPMGPPQRPMGMPQQPMGATPPPPESMPKEIGDLIAQVVEGFRAYRDAYWPGVQKFATQGGPQNPQEEKEALRQAWYGFCDLLRAGFDRIPLDIMQETGRQVIQKPVTEYWNRQTSPSPGPVAPYPTPGYPQPGR